MENQFYRCFNNIHVLRNSNIDSLAVKLGFAELQNKAWRIIHWAFAIETFNDTINNVNSSSNLKFCLKSFQLQIFYIAKMPTKL